MLREAKCITLDIRPDSGCDIVSDICDMKAVQSDTYDLVFANGVLGSAHDDEAALSEVNRVLVEGGLFVNSDYNIDNLNTLKEPLPIYGEEYFKKNIAFFRYYTETEFTSLVSRHFHNVECYKIRDIITGITRNWYRCVK